MIRIRHIPLFLAFAGLMALSMYVPALHGLVYDRFREARAFFYSGTLGLFAVMITTIIENPIMMFTAAVRPSA